ncbi:hypothetical protein FCN80_00930 [Martelella alba]|uniref:Uncharacterized protein n=1 Tax=Martelella alba TaxID=2590451 RepID=A0ABY2SS55_9HYPH|nr:hypothetical protein FCN80_00930 [Martelella alba]
MPDTTGGHADDTGHAGAAGGGLSPAGLLNHASSYGAWCQTLKSKLDSIKALYATPAATGGK